MDQSEKSTDIAKLTRKRTTRGTPRLFAFRVAGVSFSFATTEVHRER